MSSPGSARTSSIICALVKPPHLRGAGARSERGINRVDVQRDVHRLAPKRLQVALDRRHSLFVKFFRGDHADSVRTREVEIIFAIDLAA
jgi:hypothetical protein